MFPHILSSTHPYVPHMYCSPSGLPRNQGTLTLVKGPVRVPDSYQFGDGLVVPMWAGEELGWSVKE